MRIYVIVHTILGGSPVIPTVDLAGQWQAKMASIEIWIPWRKCAQAPSSLAAELSSQTSYSTDQQSWQVYVCVCVGGGGGGHKNDKMIKKKKTRFGQMPMLVSRCYLIHTRFLPACIRLVHNQRTCRPPSRHKPSKVTCFHHYIIAVCKKKYNKKEKAAENRQEKEDVHCCVFRSSQAKWSKK